MHLAVCDDNSAALERIVGLLEDYRREKQAPITWHTFLSAAEMVSSMHAANYDLLLLDILMPGVNGMEAAREIRGFDRDVAIIFLTASPEYAMEGYAVNARDYLLKPVDRTRLFASLDRLLTERDALPKAFHIKTASGMARIPYNAVVYAEVLNKQLYFHLSDDSVRQTRAPLSEYEPLLLQQGSFVKVHRSYIVNLWHMAELTTDALQTYGGQTIPISRLLYTKVRHAYMDHLFTEMETPS